MERPNIKNMNDEEYSKFIEAEHYRLFKQPNCISITGMYDCHLFHKIPGRTVDEVIQNWIEHNSSPNMAVGYNNEEVDIGPSYLCPVIVLRDKQELRRVGKGVPWLSKLNKPDEEKLSAYRESLLADKEIVRLLEERES